MALLPLPAVSNPHQKARQSVYHPPQTASPAFRPGSRYSLSRRSCLRCRLIVRHQQPGVCHSGSYCFLLESKQSSDGHEVINSRVHRIIPPLYIDPTIGNRALKLRVHIVKKLIAIVHDERTRNVRPESSKKDSFDKTRKGQDPRMKEVTKDIDSKFGEEMKNSW